MVKKKIMETAINVRSKAYALENKCNATMLTAGAFAATALTNAGFCDAKGALKEVFAEVGILIGILGVVFAVFGVIHYATANSEGDGPAKHKAQMQIASGGMVLLLGAGLATFGGKILAQLT